MSDIPFIEKNKDYLNQLLDSQRDLRRQMVDFALSIDQVFENMSQKLTYDDKIDIIKSITSKFLDEVSNASSILDIHYQNVIKDLKYFEDTGNIKTIKVQNAQIADLISNLNIQNQELDRIKQIVNDQSKHIADLNDIIDSKNQHINNLKKFIADNGALIRTLQTKIDDVRKRLMSYEVSTPMFKKKAYIIVYTDELDAINKLLTI